MSTLGWILSVVGVVGVGGAIALAVFAPLVLAGIWKFILDALGRLVETRAGVGLLVGLACLTVGVLYGQHEAASRVRAQWSAANARAADEARERDKTVAAEAEALGRSHADAELQNSKTQTEALNAYIKELEKRPGANSCLDTDADIKRLQHLR